MKRLFTLILTLLCLLPLAAHAGASGWQRDSDVGVRLIAGVEGAGTEKQIPLGLEIDLAPGWHTYWRTPGPLGLPPQFDWKNSQTEQGNLDSATLLYPAPIQFGDPGFESFGYRGHIVLPIDARVKEAGKPLALDATLDLLVCSTTCVPKHYTFNLTIPAGDRAPSTEAPLIDEARAKVPARGDHSKIVITSVERAQDSIRITFTRTQDYVGPGIFIENDRNVLFQNPELIANETTEATFILKPADKLPEGVTLEKLPLTVTIVDGAYAMEQTLDPSAPTPAAPASPEPAQPSAPLWVFVLLAIMGGFILNLTPCVLPVLSLKILSVVNHGGARHEHVRSSFLTTAAGIMASFMVLAGVTIALKATGQAIGWGVQFQQPVFLVFLIVLLTLFAANLWDLYEIALPHALTTRLAANPRSNLLGDFITGAFATLLATPCSAPFLGTAVGFALTAGAREILVIFAALGFGMVIPYLVVVAWPRLATLLPKPGPWMVTLRRVMGTLLILTAFWLVYVLSVQIALYSVVVVAACMIGIALTLSMQRHTRRLALARGVVTMLMLLAFVAAFKTAGPAAVAADATAWQKFDEAALNRYLSEGKTVFIDVTADWCVNCKANTQFTLGRDDVKRCLFDSADVIAMRADWTNPDPSIADFLKRHGRYGIPFNAVFGPAKPQGVVLPEILTPTIVMDGLTKAHAKPYSC